MGKYWLVLVWIKLSKFGKWQQVEKFSNSVILAVLILSPLALMGIYLLPEIRVEILKFGDAASCAITASK
jgi:hypothetical protein